MNSYLNREYFVLKTSSDDAIGLLSLILPTVGPSTFNFSLHRVGHDHKNDEFMDLSHKSIDYAEYETHLAAFETLKELEMVQSWSDSTNTILYVMVRQPEESDETS